MVGGGGAAGKYQGAGETRGGDVFEGEGTGARLCKSAGAGKHTRNAAGVGGGGAGVTDREVAAIQGDDGTGGGGKGADGGGASRLRPSAACAGEHNLGAAKALGGVGGNGVGGGDSDGFGVSRGRRAADKGVGIEREKTSAAISAVVHGDAAPDDNAGFVNLPAANSETGSAGVVEGDSAGIRVNNEASGGCHARHRERTRIGNIQFPGFNLESVGKCVRPACNREISVKSGDAGDFEGRAGKSRRASDTQRAADGKRVAGSGQGAANIQTDGTACQGNDIGADVPSVFEIAGNGLRARARPPAINQQRVEGLR